MSGGSLDYFFSDLESHVGDFKDRELDDLVKDLAKLFYEREWYTSGDTNEGTWVEARDAFKKKWFTKYSREERIESYLNDIKNEMLSMLGVSDKYCKNCKYWTKENDKDSPYGFCEHEKHCVTHRSESCNKFEKKHNC